MHLCVLWHHSDMCHLTAFLLWMISLWDRQEHLEGWRQTYWLSLPMATGSGIPFLVELSYPHHKKSSRRDSCTASSPWWHLLRSDLISVSTWRGAKQPRIGIVLSSCTQARPLSAFCCGTELPATGERWPPCRSLFACCSISTVLSRRWASGLGECPSMSWVYQPPPPFLKNRSVFMSAASTGHYHPWLFIVFFFFFSTGTNL